MPFIAFSSEQRIQLVCLRRWRYRLPPWKTDTQKDSPDFTLRIFNRVTILLTLDPWWLIDWGPVVVLNGGDGRRGSVSPSFLKNFSSVPSLCLSFCFVANTYSKRYSGVGAGSPYCKIYSSPVLRPGRDFLVSSIFTEGKDPISTTPIVSVTTVLPPPQPILWFLSRPHHQT